MPLLDTDKNRGLAVEAGLQPPDAFADEFQLAYERSPERVDEAIRADIDRVFGQLRKERRLPDLTILGETPLEQLNQMVAAQDFRGVDEFQQLARRAAERKGEVRDYGMLTTFAIDPFVNPGEWVAGGVAGGALGGFLMRGGSFAVRRWGMANIAKTAGAEGLLESAIAAPFSFERNLRIAQTDILSGVAPEEANANAKLAATAETLFGFALGAGLGGLVEAGVGAAAARQFTPKEAEAALAIVQRQYAARTFQPELRGESAAALTKEFRELEAALQQPDGKLFIGELKKRVKGKTSDELDAIIHGGEKYAALAAMLPNVRATATDNDVENMLQVLQGDRPKAADEPEFDLSADFRKTLDPDEARCARPARQRAADGRGTH